jgi:hypothetical protein
MHNRHKYVYTEHAIASDENGFQFFFYATCFETMNGAEEMMISGLVHVKFLTVRSFRLLSVQLVTFHFPWTDTCTEKRNFTKKKAKNNKENFKLGTFLLL